MIRPTKRLAFHVCLRARILLLLIIVLIGTRTVRALSSSTGVRGALRKKQSVAIIGGGIAGLSCAEHLSLHNGSDDDDTTDEFEVTVFDTGRLRPGGRCSSRQANDPPKQDDEATTINPILSKFRYDHAAQIISVPSINNNPQEHSDQYRDFYQQVQQWEKEGILTQFPQDSVFNIRSHKKFDPIPISETSNKLYFGTNGMGSIPEAIVKQSGGRFKVQQDVWVSPSNGVKYLLANNNKNATPQWRVQAAGQVLGTFDCIVIAHNGKCADRLMSKTPAKDLHKLLRVNFAPNVPAHGGNRMTLNSLYSLTFAVPKNNSLLSKHLPDTFIAGFIQNHPALRFLTCQTRKYAPVAGQDETVEVWTVLSS